MNLAQLIPAEWAQENCPPRHAIIRPEDVVLAAPPRPEPSPAYVGPRVRIHERPARRSGGFVRKAILEALEASPGRPLRSAEIAKAIRAGGIDQSTVCSVLIALRREDLVARNGALRPYTYAITDFGRRWLKARR